MDSTGQAARAAAIMRAGGLIAYPTEGVWGLGCDPWNAASVERLLTIKQRQVAKGLILVAAGCDQLEPWLETLDEAQRRRVCTPSDPPTTWLVPDPRSLAPDWIRGDHDGVALRVSGHPVVAALCRAFGGPVVSTSANPGGLPAARSLDEAQRYFGSAIDRYLAGEVDPGRGASIIRDLVTGKVIRGLSVESGSS